MDSEKPSGKSRVKVFVRLRPVTGEHEEMVQAETKRILLKDPVQKKASEFLLDRILDSKSPQVDVFSEVGLPLANHVMAGYNACCFAYGQTGSGKTYSMFGHENGSHELRGVVPLAMEHIFSQISSSSASFKCTVSFLEVYLDQVRDLVAASKGGGSRPSSRPTSASRSRPGSASRSGLERPPSGGGVGAKPKWLDLQEDENGNVVVKDQMFTEVSTKEEALAIVKAGMALRHTEATAMNDVSSRSHTIFTLTVEQTRSGSDQVLKGKLNLVDLAGSERLKKTESDGQRLKEAKSINTSLTALGKVVLTLAQGEPGSHVPYRDSKLTRILKESLSGNSVTALLANLNPTTDNYEECVNTLQFAIRCSTVQTTPRVNYVQPDQLSAQGGGVVSQLQAEIAALKLELDTVHGHYQKKLEAVGGSMGPLERGEGGSQPDSEGSQLMSGASNEKKEEHAKAVQINAPGPKEPAARKQSARPALTAPVVTGRMNRTESMGRGGQAPQEPMVPLVELEEAKAEVTNLKFKLEQSRAVIQEQRERIVRDEDKFSLSHSKLNKQLHLVNYQQERDQMAMRSEREETKEIVTVRIQQLQDQNSDLKKQVADLMASKLQEKELLTNNKELQGQLIQRSRVEAGEQYASQVKMLEQQKKKQLENLKEQSTFFLNKRTAELREVQTEAARAQHQAQQTLAEVKEEGLYLADYVEALCLIIEKLETGQYAMRERSGIKSYVIPGKDKPPAMDLERLPSYKGRLKQAERFLKKLQGKGMVRTSMYKAAEDAIAAAGVGGTVPGGLPARPHTSGASRSGEVDKAFVEIRADRDRLDMQLKKREALIERMKSDQHRALESQLLEELASHPTVDYIKTLEEDVRRYQKALQEERKKAVQMQTALDSYRRSTTIDFTSLPAHMRRTASAGSSRAPGPLSPTRSVRSVK